MFDWILRNLDDPTAGESAEDVAQEEAAPDTEEATEEADESDESASNAEPDESDEAEDAAPDPDAELTEDELVALMSDDAAPADKTAETKADAAPADKTAETKADAAPADDVPLTPETFIEKAAAFALATDVADQAIKAFEADAAGDELPAASANALKSLAGLVKSLVSIEGLRQTQIRAVVKQQKAESATQEQRAAAAQSAALDDAGIPANKQLRALVWSQAKAAGLKLGPNNKTPTKAILAAAYRKLVGMPPPAKSAKPAPKTLAGKIRSVPPAAKAAPKRAAAATSSFAQSQKLLNEALGST